VLETAEPLPERDVAGLVRDQVIEGAVQVGWSDGQGRAVERQVEDLVEEEPAAKPGVSAGRHRRGRRSWLRHVRIIAPLAPDFTIESGCGTLARMSQAPISAADPYPRRRLRVLDTEMAYVDTGRGDPVVFLHGNPTSSYLWRNVMPHVEPESRCLAPDLVGMGDSGKAPAGSYRFVDHARYLDAWLEAVGLPSPITLVVHDWGSALGFDWTRRHPERVRGLVYMEALVRPVTWEEWPEPARGIFQAMRSPAGEELVLAKNVFVERILPRSVLRGLTEAEMAVYRRPYLEPGESRRPTLTWPREIPIAGEPADVVAIADSYARWFSGSEIPKLFVNADPGVILTGAQREFCRRWPNQQEITVRGSHFLQEDSPSEIGRAIAAFVKRNRS
jgi:haloalkane dehalogenase